MAEARRSRAAMSSGPVTGEVVPGRARLLAVVVVVMPADPVSLDAVRDIFRGGGRMSSPATKMNRLMVERGARMGESRVDEEVEGASEDKSSMRDTRDGRT